MYQLYIGNKNYSSWSLRPWLLMSHFGIPFEEHMVSVAGRGANDLHREYSANGLVPCLHDNGFQVWDTLAIAEYLAEQHNDLWPSNHKARARARSISAEMHSGFGALRAAMPMNIKMTLQGAALPADVAADVARIDAIWTQTRAEFGDKSSVRPYLFGDFSVADAMFAPIVWRLNSYNVPLSSAAQAYLNNMLNHPHMQAWRDAAVAETTALPHYDNAALSLYGPAR